MPFKKPLTYTTAIVELMVEVDFNYYPGDHGRMYMPNGDPGYPPEPAEIEILHVWLSPPQVPHIESTDPSLKAPAKLDILEYLTDEQVEELEQQVEEDYDWEAEHAGEAV